MSNYKILTLSGVTCSGKTSIARELIQGSIDKELRRGPEFKVLTSYTTRNPRKNDLPNEYEYLTEDQFIEMESSFLWKSGHGRNTKYGTRKVDVDNALRADYVSIMILVPEVIPKLFNYVPRDSVLPVFVETPDDVELAGRFRQRGDSEDEIATRLKQSEYWELKARKSSLPYRFVKNLNNQLYLAAENIRGYLN